MSAASLQRHLEPLGFGLARLFVLDTGSVRWAGRNRPLPAHQGQRRLSSILHPAMLLGPLTEQHWSNEGVALFYQATTAAAKHHAFIEARRSAHSEVCFPYPPLGPHAEEFICPPDFWECDDARAAQLNIDEAHFRERCVAVLRERLKPGALIHDPACSTGELIAHLAQALPRCLCLGSDLSVSMVRYAAQRHAGLPVRFRQADAARESPACDALILRFLNAEVVTRHDADTLLRTLLGSLKPGGVALVFGHTPVLPAVRWVAQTLGITLEACIAARPGQLELFQFYQLTRPSA
ncbi:MULTISPECIES: class I SAM-dependent methyltransferase [unclassified Pseudomonas]|uniref:class I SAM-dependent methyltransferase n=1 Tax=unclassified Pseudomonas TaxID=196821 RepID=UPI000C86D9DB|nr:MULTISPECIES: class I SAM-dependent methyltransferase [unclassified Pseudomonas]PMV25012.1 class I SAM-dependent methyltransferase [Pseudomonas sp. FW305-3-2-15-C-TSA2]PMV28717.1 class I SAM-dependent methyltransferase [Pseudomonas sp. DP16D-L5]PMV33249.1 class I SAM-dependent methyltransferase [Pseudomonas sp. FW305-3-2-15-A-LB2]PMV48920.1 class I SAM-dependent methyltransferase [Pseudomonas sp. FW305-3-2-15-C-R2A1]PMV53464.1 class I SAM-dependent methyltransferase [Pseudomonas sp. FW305-3